MADFRSPADVQAWVNANGVEALRHAVDSGRFANQNKRQAEAWLNAQDRAATAELVKAEQTLDERSVAAAERSAEAARASARWAMWAVVIAVVALALSTYQVLASRAGS